MKTWKQGVIGKIQLDNGAVVYSKCLKYPLLKIAISYDYEKSVLSGFLIAAFVDLNVLKKIDKVGSEKLTNEEKKFGQAFDMEYFPGTAKIEKLKNSETESSSDIKGISNQGIIDWTMLNEVVRIEKEKRSLHK